jgi:hypothetical protein
LGQVAQLTCGQEGTQLAESGETKLRLALTPREAAPPA